MVRAPLLAGALAALSACSSPDNSTPSTSPGGAGSNTGGSAASSGGGGSGGAVAGGTGGSGGLAGSGGVAGGSAGATALGGGGSGGLAGGSGGSGGVAAGGASDNAGFGFGGALTECSEPSIDRLKGWNATNEGTMVPQSGSLLVPRGDGYVAQVEWLNNEWHVVPVVISNVFDSSVDLTSSYGFELTYSSTDTIWVQMRSATHWSGGTQYVAEIPSTEGVEQTFVVPFAEENWGPHPELGTPDWSYASNLADVRGLVFVGNTPNVLTFSGLRIDGFEPPCD